MRCLKLLMAAGLVLAVTGTAGATTFATGVDSMSYNITTWSIRTGWTSGRWLNQTPEYFMFDTSWADRYKVTDPPYPLYYDYGPPAVGQAMSGLGYDGRGVQPNQLLAAWWPIPQTVRGQ